MKELLHSCLATFLCCSLAPTGGKRTNVIEYITETRFHATMSWRKELCCPRQARITEELVIERPRDKDTLVKRRWEEVRLSYEPLDGTRL